MKSHKKKEAAKPVQRQPDTRGYKTYSRPGSNLGAIFQRVQQSDRVKEQNAWQQKADEFVAQRVNFSNADSPVQMVKISPILNSDTLKEVVKKMRERAEKESGTAALQNMLYNFESMNEDYSYFLATNELKGEEERFGLMSIGNVPALKPGEQGINPNLESSIWVDGLVAEKNSKLGAHLIKHAELLAIKSEKGIALAAYEYDPRDQDSKEKSYTIAPYYELKRGYQYSGEAYEEVDDDKSYYYPIYHSTPLSMAKLAAERAKGSTGLNLLMEENS